MITIKNILLQITSKLIELYPSRFQQKFSEEIYSTFHELLDEYVDRGIISLLMKWFSEIYILFFSILREHQYELNKGDLNMQPIRWTWQNICAVVSPVFLWLGILRLNEIGIFFQPTDSGLTLKQVFSIFSADGSIIPLDRFLAQLSFGEKLWFLTDRYLTFFSFSNIFSPFQFNVGASFILAGLFMIGIAWYGEKRFSVATMPSLGVMGYFVMLAVSNTIKISPALQGIIAGAGPLVLLLIWLSWKNVTMKFPKQVWDSFFALLLVILLTVLGGFLFKKPLTLSNHIFVDLGQIIGGVTFIIGAASFASLLGTRFAPKYGSKAVLFITGFICFAMMVPLVGLEANGGMMTTSIGMLGFITFQNYESILFIVVFFLIIPVLYLNSSTLTAKRVSIMVPMITVYTVMIFVQGYEEGWTSTLIILASNLIQGLIGINMAIHLYEHLSQITDETETDFVNLNSNKKSILAN